MKIEAGKTGQPNGTSTYNSLDRWQVSKLITLAELEAMNVFSSEEQLTPKLNQSERLYFAGPWFTEKAKAFYDSAVTIAIALKLFSHYKVYFPRQEVNEKPSHAFTKNVCNIENCDIVVAFVDEKDVGTAWEIGMAYSLGKKVILIGLDDTTFTSHTNVMLAFTGECTTLSQFAKILLKQDYKTIKIEDKWEGIE